MGECGLDLQAAWDPGSQHRTGFCLVLQVLPTCFTSRETKAEGRCWQSIWRCVTDTNTRKISLLLLPSRLLPGPG